MFWWMEKHVQSTLRRGLERTDLLHLSVCENIGKVKVLLCTHPMHLQLPLQRLVPPHTRPRQKDQSDGSNEND